MFGRGVADLLRPPERLSPSQWAARHIVLDRAQTAFVGPLNHARAPYLPGLIDMTMRPGVAEVTVRKGSQVGVSAAFRWLLGYMADREPDPCGLAMPDKEKGEQIVNNRLLPMFRNTPALRALATGNRYDQDRQEIKLSNGFLLYLMWSGSPTSMASNPIRLAINDEVDKFADWAAEGETHGAYLIRRRLRTYTSRARMINISTPTTSTGHITHLWNDGTVFLWFVMDCPSCGLAQRLVWDRVKWDDLGITDRRERASEILARGNAAAWYECARCKARWSDQDKQRTMVKTGRWATCDGEGVADGEIPDALAVARWPAGTRISAHVWAAYAAWDSIPEIVARYLRSVGNYAAMMDFTQNDLGEPFDQQLSREPSADISARAKQSTHPEGRLPDWAARLLMAIDTQKDHFWYVVRAFGPGGRSMRVLHGRAESFDDLDRLIYRTPFPFIGDVFPPMAIDLAGIDSGGTRSADEEGRAPLPSRTMEVYAWAIQRQNRVRVIKGDSHPKPGSAGFRRGQGQYAAGAKNFLVPLWLIDTHHYQDELAWQLGQQIDGPASTETGEVTQEPMWALNAREDEEYARHMANLIKVAIKERGVITQRWRPVSSGARVDYRACEGYLLALADMAGVRILPTLEDWMQARRAAATRRRPQTKPPLTTPDGRPYLVTRR